MLFCLDTKLLHYHLSCLNLFKTELLLKVFDSHDDVTISVPVIFHGPVKVLGSWNMTGLIHDVDIDFIMRDALLTVGNQVGNTFQVQIESI